MNGAIAVQSYGTYVRNDDGHALMFSCYQRRNLCCVTGARLGTEAQLAGAKFHGEGTILSVESLKATLLKRERERWR